MGAVSSALEEEGKETTQPEIRHISQSPVQSAPENSKDDTFTSHHKDISCKIEEKPCCKDDCKDSEKEKIESSVSRSTLLVDTELKPCCACPETKKARDTCIIENGEEKCKYLIEAHKQCLRDLGFRI